MFQVIDWSDLGERAIWTFAQAFLGTFAVVNVLDVDELKAAALAGVAAGIAAVLSLIKNVVKQNQAA